MNIQMEDLNVVTSDKLYLDHHYEKIDEEGILSQKIFGPIKAWRCECGNLNSKILYENIRCEKCHVLCADPDLRYKTFAKIKLPFPIYKNSESSKRKLLKLAGDHKNILDPQQMDRNIEQSLFIEFKLSKHKGGLYPKLTDKFSIDCCVPVRITGTYSLYLALFVGWKIMGNTECNKLLNHCFSYDILVTPPKAREVSIQIKKGKRELAVNSINDHYCKLLRTASFDWPNITDPEEMRNEYVTLAEEINKTGFSKEGGYYLDHYQVINNDELVCRYQYHVNKIYTEIVNSLATKTGYIRKDFIGRSIDFSARAHIVSDPSLRGYEISISKLIFIKLWFIEYLYFIKVILDKQQDYTKLLSYVEFTNMYVNLDKINHIDEFIEWSFNDDEDSLNKLVFINRQPTLWRYGCPAMKVVKVVDSDTIGLSNLTLEMLNADFDGDTVACYRIHDNTALQELESKAYMKHEVTYDHNVSMLQKCRLEAIYPIFKLLSCKIDRKQDTYPCLDLKSLPVTFDHTLYLNTPIKIKNKIYSYGVCLFNKWCDFEKIQITEFKGAEEVSRLIFQDSIEKNEFNNRVHNLSKRMFWYASIHPELALTLSLDEFNAIDIEKYKILMTKLPDNPHIGQHVYKYIMDGVYEAIPDDFKLKALLEIKVNKTQLSRLLCGIGYIADSNNIIDSKPITASIMSGLNENTFFQTVSGTRKGLADKANVTPESGYIERSMTVNLSPVEIGLDDCGTHLTFNITILSESHATSLRNRYHMKDDVLHLYEPEDLKSEVGKSYSFRSPMCCANPGFGICSTCFGKYEGIKSKHVGIIAGQSISERLTQLTMRTFHTSGSCDLPTNPEVIKIIKAQMIDIVNDTATKTSILKFTPTLTMTQIDLFSEIDGFATYQHNESITELTYYNIYKVENRDVTAIIKDMKKLTQAESGKLTPISDVYDRFITNALSVGQIYSTFVEIVLCNMYITKNKEILRYALQHNVNAIPHKKLNIMRLHSVISKLLGLLYEPNSQSICEFANTTNPLPITANTVLERFWNEL